MVSIDRNIAYEELKSFLEAKLETRDIFIVYEGITDWDDMESQQYVFHYTIDNELKEGFKFSLDLISIADDLRKTEWLSFEISNYFNCRTFCDASRIILMERNFYYSLLFEANHVYLVSDQLFEETGEVTKIAKLDYSVPNLSISKQ